MTVGIGTGQRIGGVTFSFALWKRKVASMYNSATVMLVIRVLAGVAMMGFCGVLILAVMGKPVPEALSWPIGTSLGILGGILVNPEREHDDRDYATGRSRRTRDQ